MSIQKVVPFSHSRTAELNDRERVCLGLLARGMTSLQMSAALSVPEAEIEIALANATEKLGGHNRLHAVSLGLLRGLLDDDHP